MAYNESGELSPSESYQLGGYTFQLRSNYDGDEEVTGIVARMTYNGETKVKGIDIAGQATIESWSVEANESSADIYALVRIPKTDAKKRTSPLVPVPIASGSGTIIGTQRQTGESIVLETGGTAGCIVSDYNYDLRINTVTASASPFQPSGSFTYDGKTVYAYAHNYPDWYAPYNVPINAAMPDYNYLHVAWTMIYGIPSYDPKDFEEKEELIGRFAIDLTEADGGPEGDWDEPGDTGDPSYTLNVYVTGASAGTHNADSFPSNNETVKDYGCGGDGGHGGGGGAGASTVIIYEFATSRAGNVNQEAYTREPGVGSGGGRGGKGGDGCILIYY